MLRAIKSSLAFRVLCVSVIGVGALQMLGYVYAAQNSGPFATTGSPQVVLKLATSSGSYIATKA